MKIYEREKKLLYDRQKKLREYYENNSGCACDEKFISITQAEYDTLVENNEVDKSKYYMIVG